MSNPAEERKMKIVLLLSQMQSFLNRLRFLSHSGPSVADVADRANNWLAEAEKRGGEISPFDTMISAVNNFEPLFVIRGKR